MNLDESLPISGIQPYIDHGRCRGDITHRILKTQFSPVPHPFHLPVVPESVSFWETMPPPLVHAVKEVLLSHGSNSTLEEGQRVLLMPPQHQSQGAGTLDCLQAECRFSSSLSNSPLYNWETEALGDENRPRPPRGRILRWRI